MSWKSLPYWLKGGIIGFGAYILLLIVRSILMSIPLKIKLIGDFVILSLALTYIWFVFMPFFILLGMFIGWIVGKIKSKK